MKIIFAVALILTLAVASHAMYFTEGTSELSVSGLLDFKSANGTLTDIDLFYGYFVMDYLEAGLAGSFMNDDTISTWALGPKAEYNFDIGYSAVPFVGGSLMFAASKLKEGEKSDHAFIAGAEAGAKFFITEYAALSAALVGEIATDDIYPSGDDERDSTDLRFELGMRIFF
jgi:hypothetical protein